MERFDKDDRLHQELVFILQESVYKRTVFVGLCWSNPEPEYDMVTKQEGLALVQFPDSLLGRRFTVQVIDGGFILKFMGKIRTVYCDYFED